MALLTDDGVRAVGERPAEKLQEGWEGDVFCGGVFSSKDVSHAKRREKTRGMMYLFLLRSSSMVSVLTNFLSVAAT